MRIWLGFFTACIATGMVLSACGPTQSVQDAMDQAALRKLFGLPRGAQVVSYDGYPAMVGFGQREGLSLSAAYELSDREVESFLAGAAQRGWVPLPLPVGLESHIPFRELSVPLDRTDGLYLCRTAGDEVLHPAGTKDCLEVRQPNDLLLGIFDATTNRVWVTVRAGY